MTLHLRLYRIGMRAAAIAAPLVFRWRKSKGKELEGRYNERLARALPQREDGTLVWLHGASLGESKLLLGLADELRKLHPETVLLFTSQTASSANIVGANLPGRATHQMLPLDTPAAAQRFIAHWQPRLSIFAEGEVWPNLLEAAKRSGSQTALINARMRKSSLERWNKAKQSAQHVFAQFDAIIAADANTASGLSRLLGRDIENSGNLKAALVKPAIDSKPAQEIDAWQAEHGVSSIVLGASTHEGEEAFLLDALKELPETTRLIIAPRHLSRADGIEALIQTAGYSYIKRSTGQTARADTRIILADTFGEMDLWYASADALFLGGGLPADVGGHSPLEPLRFGLAIATGPHTENFADIHAELGPRGWSNIVKTPSEFARFAQSATPIPASEIGTYFAARKGALQHTLAMLSNLLNEAG